MDVSDHRPQPKLSLDADDVRDAYRRWAGVYDRVFGGVSGAGRRRAVAAINALDARDVLEMGVGTGLSLHAYAPDKRVTGIDLSAEMLAHARARVSEEKLAHVVGLDIADAENTTFPAASFDVAAAMFVASVVPHPRALLAEMKRVVRPGGHLLFVNHFTAERGLRLAVERGLGRASRLLGWHPDFALEALLPPSDRARATVLPVPPLGLFTLVTLRND